MPVTLVVQTKITPPPISARTLPRPRVTQALTEAMQYRLTILQAGAGYGKSTALAVLAHELQQPLIWYQVTEEDGDPLVFLLHLCHAAQTAIPALHGLPTPTLEAWEGTRGPMPSAQIVDQMLNALAEGLRHRALLVLDDVHLAANSREIALILDRLIGLAPSPLHILLAGRPPLKLPNLARWRAQGEVLVIDQALLAFTDSEIGQLFAQRYGYELAPEEVQALQTNTEGWAIALQLIWQNLRSGSSPSVSASLTRPASSLEGLFEILAQEVFEGQPPDVQAFLLSSATLRVMTAEACDALRNSRQAAKHETVEVDASGASSDAMLAYLVRQDLFVVPAGDGSLRYHHVFHDFLRQAAPLQQRRRWHASAAAYYQKCQNLDETCYHLLQAAEWERAAALLDSYGAHLLGKGRLDSLASALNGMPPETLQQHPALLSYLGDLARLHSRFQEALGWYQQAEAIWRARGQREGIARALRGQARVYIDTVDPSGAEALLQEATRLSDGTPDRESKARLYELLAENKLNLGQSEEAERLRQQAEALRSEGPSDSQLLFRVLLRTGRLAEARHGLEARAEAERRQPVTTPRAHRETLLLLSLIYAFQGHAEQAYAAAQEGTRRGDELQSPFITAVGYMRQGHALMLLPESERYAQARQQFEQSIALSRSLAVSRLRVEAYWGLCRAYGYQGDLAQATQVAQEAIEIALQAGDEWIASLVRLALGASLSLALRYEAAENWLAQAQRGFQECSDPFGWLAARLWLCHGWLKGKESLRLEQALPEALAVCRQGGYDFLFQRPSLLGPPDERLWTPLLVYAREHNWERGYASRLLKSIGLTDVQFHPGYALRVYTLGTFQVWRGQEQIPNNSWRREKARQLFQLFLTFRDTPLDRDQICEHLWPGADPSTAQRNFKVTLNTLYHALEPEREPGSESAYILREGSTYGLRPGADLWLDAQAFISQVQRFEGLQAKEAEDLETMTELLVQALALYGGEYLPETRYESWAAAEREYLSVQFLRTADRLSELYLRQGRFEETVQICQRILANDNCWERAYRHLMLAFDGLGDHGQMARSYQRCVQVLSDELDVTPSAETSELYEELVGDTLVGNGKH